MSASEAVRRSFKALLSHQSQVRPTGKSIAWLHMYECALNMQARLQQAESLIQQQSLIIDKLCVQQGRNSKQSNPVTHLRQTENDYWRSWLQSSAECTAGDERHDQHHKPLREILTSQAVDYSPHTHIPSYVRAPAETCQEASHHTVGCSAPSSGHSSVGSGRNARPLPHHRRKPGKHHQLTALNSNASLENVVHHDENMCGASGCHACGWKPGQMVAVETSQALACMNNRTAGSMIGVYLKQEGQQQDGG